MNFDNAEKNGFVLFSLSICRHRLDLRPLDVCAASPVDDNDVNIRAAFTRLRESTGKMNTFAHYVIPAAFKKALRLSDECWKIFWRARTQRRCCVLLLKLIATKFSHRFLSLNSKLPAVIIFWRFSSPHSESTLSITRHSWKWVRAFLPLKNGINKTKTDVVSPRTFKSSQVEIQIKIFLANCCLATRVAHLGTMERSSLMMGLSFNSVDGEQKAPSARGSVPLARWNLCLLFCYV